jgi:hypothetical protein
MGRVAESVDQQRRQKRKRRLEDQEQLDGNDRVEHKERICHARYHLWPDKGAEQRVSHA